MKNLDNSITKSFYLSGKKNFLFWSKLTNYGLYALLFAFVGIWFLIPSDFYTVLVVISSIFVTFIISIFIRYTLKIPRPQFKDLEYVPWMNKFGFPSLHSAFAFSLSTSLSLVVLQVWLSSAVWIGIILLFSSAVMIGLSRVYIGVHHFSDVVAGALLGIAVSVTLIGI